MENMLIVTDFSDASVNAGRYAIFLAKQFHVKIKLLHVFQLPVEIPESYLIYPVEQLGEQAMELLISEAKLLEEQSGTTIEKYVAGGNVTDTILSEAERLNADFIICGMKGANNILKRIFGSTATALVRRWAIPVILVPEGVSFESPTKILFAADTKHAISANNIECLRRFGEAFHSKLFIVHVMVDHQTDPVKIELSFAGLMQKLRTLHPDLHLLSGDDISMVLDHFISENNVQMLAMIPHHHSFFERMLVGSKTAEMAFWVNIPLLVLPETWGY